MKLKDILGKLAKGEELTAEEKAFLTEYDPEKVTNDAAAAARRDAEKKLADAQTALDALKKQAEDLQKEKDEAEKKKQAGMTEAQKREQAFLDLTKKVESLEAEAAKAKAEAAKLTRRNAIREAAKIAGISIAPGTVSENLFFGMLETHLADTDVADAELLTAKLDAFKTENKGIIAAPGTAGTGGKSGDPSTAAAVEKDIMSVSADQREKDLRAANLF